MKNKLITFSKRPFVRNVILLASGTAAAQVIGLVSSPIITRIYGPEAFGLMGAFMAVIGLIAPIAALTYPVAIVLPKRDQDAISLIRLSIIITVIISIISLFILVLFNKQIINIFNLKEIAPYLYLIPLVIIFSGLAQIMQQWLIRTKQFSINARVSVIQSIVLNGSKIGVGLFYPIGAMLVVLTALASGLQAGLMIVFVKRSNYKTNQAPIDKKKSLKELAMEHKDFPIYRAPQEFLNATSQGLPVLLLTAFFGPASAGFYTIGRTVLNMPANLIGNAIGDVFYPRITEARNNQENVSALIKKATWALTGVGIVPFGLVIFFGPFLFSLVFGSEWVVAGEYARWIALASFSSLINRPSVRTLAVLNAQRFHLFYTILMLVIRLGALIIGFYMFSSDLIAVALFGITGFILNIGLILLTIRFSNNQK